MIDRLRPWLPAIAWMAAIFVVSHQPKSGLPDFQTWDLLIKKSAHFLVYGLLAVLIARTGVRWSTVLLLTIAYAVADEWHQIFIPGRSGSLPDVIIDALGGVAGLFTGRRSGRKTVRSASAEPVTTRSRE